MSDLKLALSHARLSANQNLALIIKGRHGND